MNQRRAILVADLAYGDCGKGTIVDYLTRECRADTIVRFNGGPQAAHNVVTTDGRHHTFSQFGSGTLVPAVKTVLSRHVLIEPYALLNEEAHLREIGVSDAMSRLHIDSRCPVITPIHVAASRLRDVARGAGAHGTCGMGVGEWMQDWRDNSELIFFAADLANSAKVRSRLLKLQELKIQQLAGALREFATHPRLQFEVQTLRDLSWLDNALRIYRRVSERVRGGEEILRSSEKLIFEGAQGVLLDETHGFYPYSTWSTTTFYNAEQVLAEMRWDAKTMRIGVLRAYFTRHGPGPLVTEDPDLRVRLPEPHNGNGGWQGAFRVGAFDAVAARYALAAAGGADTLAVTHLDRLSQLPNRVCTAYQDENNQPFSLIHQPAPTIDDMSHLTRRLQRCTPLYKSIDPSGTSEDFIARVETLLNTPVAIQSFGPTAADKKKSAAPEISKILQN